VPVVALVDEIDAAVGVELKRRLAERYVEEHPDAGLAPSPLQRACVGILNHLQSEADDAQRSARHPRKQRNHRAADQRVLAEDAAIPCPSDRMADALTIRLNDDSALERLAELLAPRLVGRLSETAR
jgi:hypothetical protein